MHLFYNCSKNKEAGEAMFRVGKAYASSLTMEKSLTMEIESDEVFTLATVSVLAT